MTARTIANVLLLACMLTSTAIVLWFSRELRKQRQLAVMTAFAMRSVAERLMRNGGVLVCDACGIPIAPETSWSFRFGATPDDALAFHPGHEPMEGE